MGHGWSVRQSGQGFEFLRLEAMDTLVVQTEGQHSSLQLKPCPD